MNRPVRVANSSGFYGDRLAAPAEMLAGPEPIDVLTGDYLAELTMFILWKARRKDPRSGFASTFLAQIEGVMGTCLDRGVRVVSNAGGLNPRGLASGLDAVARRLGLTPRIAVVEGDDVLGALSAMQEAGEPLAHLDTGQPIRETGIEPVTANAYLGGFGIARALASGADIVVSGRVTDASLLVGPVAWWHGWSPGDFDALAGAVVAGHIIECGPQATGGNYCFAQEEVPGYRSPGYPIAEVHADGSSVITKQPGTGGAVTLGTVTAQLLYEIDTQRYQNPDVVARFDSIRLDVEGKDRVRVSGVRGEPPSGLLKMGINYSGGWRNAMSLRLTGLNKDDKAARAVAVLQEVVGGFDQFGEIQIQRIGSELRIAAKDSDRDKVGRTFSRAVTELLLASYAGACTTTPPTEASEYGVFWPSLVPAALVEHAVILPDGQREVIPPAERTGGIDLEPESLRRTVVAERTVSVPLGRICGGRSGDKGGNVNVGLWVRTEEEFHWLAGELTVDTFKQLLPECRELAVHRYEFANLRALNFVVIGLLGQGVASSLRYDPQAKGLAEELRSQRVDVPIRLLTRVGSAYQSIGTAL